MTLKPFLIALGIGGGGVAAVMLTNAPKSENHALMLPQEEVSIWQHMGVLARDPNTNEVVAEYPSAYDASIITSIPQDQLINSMMSGETIQGVVFELK